MAGNQSIEGINALAYARGTQEPSNRDVFWIDDNIEGAIYNRVKVFNSESGSWELTSRTSLELLGDLKTVDGAGSGLDADTLQGYTPTQLMSETALSSGQMLVGQPDKVGTAQTIGGIATINDSGVLAYVNNSISHTALSDIGSNTHAQIDSKLASIDNIEGNLTNVGTLGAGQDGYAVVWDNATSRFVMAEGGGDSIYTASGTVPTSVVATLTDNITFGNSVDSLVKIHSTGGGLKNVLELGSSLTNTDGVGSTIEFINEPTGTRLTRISSETFGGWTNIGIRLYSYNGSNGIGDSFLGQDRYGTLIGKNLTERIASEDNLIYGETFIQGIDTLSTSTALSIYDNDTTPSELWDWRNNGDLYINQGSDINYLGDIEFKGSEGSLSSLIGGSFWQIRDTTNTTKAAAIKIARFGESSGIAAFANYSTTYSLSGYAGKTVVNSSLNNSNGLMLMNFTGGIWFNMGNGSGSDGSTAGRKMFIDTDVVKIHNVSELIYHPTDNEPTVIGTENVSFQEGHTLIQGADTLSTSTALSIYDNDTTPSLLFDVRNNGDIGFFGGTAAGQQSTTGTVAGFSAGVGTGVNADSTFTGGTGVTAYTISDVVLALKNLNILQA